MRVHPLIDVSLGVGNFDDLELVAAGDYRSGKPGCPRVQPLVVLDLNGLISHAVVLRHCRSSSNEGLFTQFTKQRARQPEFEAGLVHRVQVRRLTAWTGRWATPGAGRARLSSG